MVEPLLTMSLVVFYATNSLKFRSRAKVPAVLLYAGIFWRHRNAISSSFQVASG